MITASQKAFVTARGTCRNQELCSKPKPLTGNAFFCAEMTCKSRARFRCFGRGVFCGINGVMNRQEILDRLRENEAALRAQGVAHAALFGSVARREARPDSDIDIMVEIAPEIP